jgi:hypothetical protein
MQASCGNKGGELRGVGRPDWRASNLSWRKDANMWKISSGLWFGTMRTLSFAVTAPQRPTHHI